MGRPPVSSNIIEINGNTNHRTRAELDLRKENEAALMTHRKMEIWPEVKVNKLAREEFERVSELLAIIDKDDALQEGVVNRYCLLRAECVDFEKKREIFFRSIAELRKEYKADRLLPNQYFTLVADMQRSVVGIDKQIMSKRNMMLAIEKENLMTIASALRSIPKKVEKKEKASGMAGFLTKRAENG